MKQKIVPGAELDILSPEEAGSLIASLLGSQGRPEDRVRAEANKRTDAAGAVTLELYTVPVGQAFRLGRLLVSADGFTAAVPFTGAGAFVEILRNDVPVDFKSLTAAPGLPALSEYSSFSAPYYTNGDMLAVRLTAGPSSTNIVARMEGLLEALERVPSNGHGQGRRR